LKGLRQARCLKLGKQKNRGWHTAFFQNFQSFSVAQHLLEFENQ